MLEAVCFVSSVVTCALMYTHTQLHTHTHNKYSIQSERCAASPPPPPPLQSNIIQELEVRVAELSKSEEMRADAYSRLAKEKVALEQTLEATEGELHTVRERSATAQLWMGGCSVVETEGGYLSSLVNFCNKDAMTSHCHPLPLLSPPSFPSLYIGGRMEQLEGDYSSLEKEKSFLLEGQEKRSEEAIQQLKKQFRLQDDKVQCVCVWYIRTKGWRC